jgi:hypothetical protein
VPAMVVVVLAVMMMPVMMPMAVPVVDIAMVVVRRMAINRRVMIDGRRENDARRINRDYGRADGRGRYNHCRDRQRYANVDAKRYAGARRGGGGGSEGDCDCTDENYLFHSYQFDELFTGIFIP